MAQVKVYWGSGSPFAWKILIGLEERNIPYESNLLSFTGGEHKKPEFLALNPRGKVPVLQCGSDTLYESMAILLYLENKFSANTLLPAANYPKIMTRAFECQYIAESTQKFLALDIKSATPEQIKETFQPALKELDQWERYFSENSGPFLFGTHVTLADVAIFPHIAISVRYGLELQKRYPKINAYYESMISRESVKKTWPPHWKESPRKTALANVTD